MKIDDNYFTTGVGRFVRNSMNLPTVNQGVASKIIDQTVLDKVYGTSDDFITRYEGFQQKYLRALETELDPRAASRANLEILRSQGKIDLTVLNKTAREQLRQTYINDILRLPQIMQEAGLPNINLPSANLYRQLFRYQVDTSLRNPAGMLLNSVLLNVNPEKVGLDAFNVGMGNIAGLRTVKQGHKKDLASLLTGKKVYTFDVETAGIFEGAQTRSMAIAEMTAGGKINVLDDFNLSYASRQMGGLNVATANGGSMAISDFLQGNTRVIPHGVEGAGFLDESSKFINKLMEADRVAGHNIYFDINALFSTMQQMAGFDKHEGAQKAIQLFTERMAKDEDFVVDTLQYTRAYLNDKVNAKLKNKAVGSDAQELSRFRDLLYSDDFMAKIHFGGSTGTSSIEAISANTNLLQLIEQDMVNGDAGAKELFEKIYGGTHIADTDAFLQSYVAKYQMSDKLDVVESAARAQYSPLVRGAQNVILGSSAITPTTNIASVSNLSEQVFQSTLTESGMKGVKLRTNIKKLGSGLLQFDSEEGLYRFAVGETITDLDQTYAEKIITNTLNKARTGAVARPKFLDDYGVNAPAITVNQSDLNIIDLGINYTQAHQVDEITNLQKTLGNVSKLADETSLMNRLGKTYQMFGSDPETTSDALRIARGGSPISGYFSVGLEDYTNRMTGAAEEFATAAQKAADPYAFLDVRSRVFSTIMADASTPYIERARAAAIANGTMQTMKYADYGDIMAEFGVTHLQGVKQFKAFDKIGEESVLRQNIFMPLSVMEKAAEKTAMPRTTNLFKTGRVSYSYATRESGNVINAMFHLAEGTSKRDARSLVSSLFDLAETANGANSANLNFEAGVLEELSKFHQEVGGILNVSKFSKDDLIDQFTERLVSGRVGIATIEGDAADQAYLALKRSGTDIATDVVSREILSPILDTVGDEALRVGPGVHQEVMRRAGLQGAMDSANGSIIGFLNDSAEILSQGNNATKARNQIRRAKLGQSPNKMLEFYINNKTKMGIAGLALGAVGLGYMAAKKYREHSLYDETLEQQPTSRMSTGQMMRQSAPASSTINSYRRDPLVTAGVVGNLDRNKVNHYKMGNDKYNHLFGG